MVLKAPIVFVTAFLLTNWVWAEDSTSTRAEKIQAFKTAQACYSDSTSSGDTQSKVQCSKKSLDLGYDLFGPEHKNTAALSYNYALALSDNGALKLSSDELHKTVKLYTGIYGPKSEKLAWVLMDLAQVESKLRSSEVMQHYHNAINIFAALDGFSDVDYANILLKASGARITYREDLPKVVKYAEQAAKIFISIEGDSSSSASLAFFNIGKLMLSEKQYVKAIEALEKSLSNPSLANYAHAFLAEAYEKTDQPLLAQKQLDALAEVSGTHSRYLKPLFVPHPKYPRKAMQRGVEGYAIVELIVTVQGGVRDPILIEENPKKMGFGKASVKAAKKLKYTPKIVDGEAVENLGVRFKFSFKMVP